MKRAPEEPATQAPYKHGSIQVRQAALKPLAARVSAPETSVGVEDPPLKRVDRFDLTPTTRARRIAGIFRGTPQETFEQAARDLSLSPGAVEAVVGLRKLVFQVGIVTDSYHIAAETVRRRVFARMLRAARLSFASQPKSDHVRRASKRQLHHRLDELLQFVPA